MSSLTHFDAQGQAHMVDVGGKPATHRIAVAEPHCHGARNPGHCAKRHRQKAMCWASPASPPSWPPRRPATLSPLSPLALTRVAVEFELQPESSSILCTATVELTGQTGVEMEALTAVQVGLLTIYDMCKAVDKGMVMGIRVMEKRGSRVAGQFEVLQKRF